MGKVYIKRITACLRDDLEEEKYFKQLNVYNNFEGICEYVTERNIETICAWLNIISVKIINTMEGTSLEGQTLSGKKMVIIGNIYTKIFIKCPNKYKLYCAIERKMPFSTFIIIPKDICKEQPIYLEYCIEDISIIKRSKNKLFLSITLFIQYKDDYLEKK